MVFMETSFIVGLNVEKDKWHKKATELFDTMEDKITSQMVVYEVLTVLRKKNQNDEKIITVFNSLVNSEDIAVLDDLVYYDEALYYTLYENKIGFFDNLSYVVMKNNDIKTIASFDPDFDIFKDIKRIG